MLRIKRAVQASFNTEASFVAAQAAAATKGTEKPTDTADQAAKDAADPMAAMERNMAPATQKSGPSFVASTLTNGNIEASGVEVEGADGGANPDAIAAEETANDYSRAVNASALGSGDKIIAGEQKLTRACTVTACKLRMPHAVSSFYDRLAIHVGQARI